MLIECKSYSPGRAVYINADKILYFVEAERGTRIVLTDKEILVGDWPSELALKIEQAEEQE